MSDSSDLTIPEELLTRYLDGTATVVEAAGQLQVSPALLSRALQARGVDTAKGLYQCRRLAHRIETTNALPPGAAPRVLAECYAEGQSLRALAKRLGVEWQAAKRALLRDRVTLRPKWHREVFHGRPGDRKRFAATLQAFRQARGWSQQTLAARCGLSRRSIGRMERGLVGPSWAALQRLVNAFEVEIAAFGVTWLPLC
jgi:transcriptional regulator with XRE-family HTH domain